MANVLNRTTKEYKESVNTPDYPVSEWIINPDISAVKGFDPKFWQIEGDNVVLADPVETEEIEKNTHSIKIVSSNVLDFDGVPMAGSLEPHMMCVCKIDLKGNDVLEGTETLRVIANPPILVPSSVTLNKGSVSFEAGPMPVGYTGEVTLRAVDPAGVFQFAETKIRYV